MGSTHSPHHGFTATFQTKRSALTRAWLSIVLVPVFFLLAFAVAQGIYVLTGYDPSAGATPPLWADLAAGLPALAILLLPCVAGVLYGLRAHSLAGLVAAFAAGVLGLGAIVLVAVNAL